MPEKFGRTYSLQIATKPAEEPSPDKPIDFSATFFSEGSVTVEYPLTCEFTITRHSLASTNTASFVIYNLSKSTRSQIFKAPYNLADRRPIRFCAGYESQNLTGALPQVFYGEIRQAGSVRHGCDMRTEIECFDAGYAMANSFSSVSISAGQSTKDLIRKLSKDLTGVSKVTIGDFFTNVGARGAAMFGSSTELLKEIAEGRFFIDSQEAFVLDKNEVIPGEVTEISARTGLIGSPRRADTMIEAAMLFEPRLRPAQLVNLISETDENYTGLYKVSGFTHRGIISGAKSGECTTTVSLFGGGPFKPISGLGL